MSLQLGHCWVSLKHQNQMGKKRLQISLQKPLPLRSQQRSILQNVGSTVKYFDHAETLLYGRVVVELLESRQIELQGMVGFRFSAREKKLSFPIM